MEGYRNNFFIFRVIDKKVNWEFLFRDERNDVSPYEIRGPVVKKVSKCFGV
jgi:hypothetical protein